MEDVFVCKSEKDFIPGMKLNKGFYFEVVKPLIDKNFKDLRYAAALTGHCSDVFGFDDFKSTDHVWGPRLQIFLEEENFKDTKKKLDEFLKYNLPFEYKGFPTNYKPVEGWFNNAYMQYKAEYPINHFIEIETVNTFFNRDLVFNKDYELSFEDWLAYPIENLLELTSGEVFCDGFGEITKAREVLKFFPEEVLLIRLFILWKAINEEQAFMGRCAERNDRIGESLITNRMLNKLMKICFYYEGKYYPYSKWFGTAFQQLDISKKIAPLIENIITSSERATRETDLRNICLEIVNKHNSLGLTDNIEAKVINYYNRGYLGFDSELMLQALSKKIEWNKIKDVELLSKIELFEDSYFGCNYFINRRIVGEAVV